MTEDIAFNAPIITRALVKLAHTNQREQEGENGRYYIIQVTLYSAVHVIQIRLPRISNSNVSEFPFIAAIQPGNGYFKMPLNSNLFQGFLTLNYVDCTVL